MRYAPLRSRKHTTAPVGRPGGHPRHGGFEPQEQTVADRVRSQAGGEYSAAWLARALGCSPDTAAELEGYWIPQGPPHLLEQTVGVFAKTLDLDAQRLLQLVNSAGSAPRSSAPSAPRRFESQRPAPQRPMAPRPQQAEPAAPAASASAPRTAEISIGSAEGVRVVKQQQPTIVYRKTRRFVGQS
jgi:hypothetical protein